MDKIFTGKKNDYLEVIKKLKALLWKEKLNSIKNQAKWLIQIFHSTITSGFFKTLVSTIE